MPTYEYHCKACDHEFEREQRITEPPVKKCPACGKFQVRRLISRSSFVLKGGGWYNDGYHNGKGAKPSKGDSNESKESTPAKTEKKADKKSDKKASSGKK